MNKKILFNIIGFYLCWWLSIYGAYIGHYYIGPLSVIIFLFVHFYKIVYHKYEFYFLLICLLIGFCIDTFFLRYQIINYEGYLPQNYNVAPLWVAFLWVCFGATIYHSFKWAKTRYTLMGILSAISGPVIYLSAEKIGVLIILKNSNLYLIIIAITWSVFIPLLIILLIPLVFPDLLPYKEPNLKIV